MFEAFKLEMVDLPWAALPVTGAGLDRGHHMAEEAPEELAEELAAFFSGEV